MGFIKNIFSNRKLSNPLDFSSLKVDMHSHLIPGIDDGVNSYEESVLLIKQLAA